MSARRHTFFNIILPIGIMLVSAIVAGFVLLNADSIIEEREREETERIAAVESNRNALRSTLLGTGAVRLSDIEHGFWYTFMDRDGNEGVAYFDLESAAHADLTEEQLRSLALIVRRGEVLERGTVRQVEEEELPSELRFHNALYESALGGTSTLAMERDLEGRRETATSDELFRLSYLKELNGEYAARDELDRENCEKYNQRCEGSVQLTLRGSVVDSAGQSVQGATVLVPSRTSVAPAETDEDGRFAFDILAHEMEKIRVRAYKRNYSDGYADAIVVLGAGAVRTTTLDDIRIESPIGIVTIDYLHRSITGPYNTFDADGSVTIQTAYSTYHIPPRSIVHAGGEPYTGDIVDVYLYEFTKGNPPPNLLQLDTFDAVRGYAGDLMKSFGMPYIQFFAPDGEELHVRSSNPMRLTYQIPDMQALYDNVDGIYEALTDADMRLLVEASRGKEYAIDREFLIENRMLRFPAFWVLDRRRSVWDNVGVTVRNPQGLVDTIFYTIRD